MTISSAERLAVRAGETDAAFQMDEDTFRAFYDRTSRMLWAYLSRVTGDRQVADDLLQETYYRFLRAGASHESEAHRRNSLFQIATNLARDGHRRRRAAPIHIQHSDEVPDRRAGDVALQAEQRTDLARAMAQLKPREREMLWLAYAHGSSHEEIADSLGLRKSSIKILLFRARRRLAAALGGARSVKGTPA